jgi:2-iminobutanoate/2-iminopropanoate deaminase
MAEALKRQSIESAMAARRGNAGPAPIPDGARVGNIIASSLIAGRDEDGTFSRDPEAQARAMFAYMVTFLERAGATTESVVQLTVYLQDESYRAAMNKAWLETFPDPNSRPGRIIVYRDFGLERARRPDPENAPVLFFEISIIAVA